MSRPFLNPDKTSRSGSIHYFEITEASRGWFGPPSLYVQYLSSECFSAKKWLKYDVWPLAILLWKLKWRRKVSKYVFDLWILPPTFLDFPKEIKPGFWVGSLFRKRFQLLQNNLKQLQTMKICIFFLSLKRQNKMWYYLMLLPTYKDSGRISWPDPGTSFWKWVLNYLIT